MAGAAAIAALPLPTARPASPVGVVLCGPKVGPALQRSTTSNACRVSEVQFYLTVGGTTARTVTG
jgi:hypothetical protein